MPETPPTPGGSKGLFDSLSMLASTLVAIARTRLELLSSDLEEEREHIFTLVVTALVALFCLGVGVVLATLLVVVLFWDSHRLLTLSILAGLFLLGGAAAGAYAMNKVRTKPRLFAASLSELSKDRHQLDTRS